MLTSIAVCLALSGKAAYDPRVLRMLMHGLVILLDRVDLFPLSSLIFRWCEDVFLRKVSQADIQANLSFGSQLLGAAKVAARFVKSSPQRSRVHELASTLLRKIEARVEAILKLDKPIVSLRQQAIEVAALWTGYQVEVVKMRLPPPCAPSSSPIVPPF